MNVPTKQFCMDLIKEMEMMPHILDHSLQVCRVALLITDLLNQTNGHLNRDLILSAALLHDITKTRAIASGEPHAQTGGQLLTELGYPEVGMIIEQHVQLMTKPDQGAICEAEIVNYADKRVLHDQIVPLNQRMDYILRQYGKKAHHRQRLMKIWKATEKLEQRIFQKLPFHADEVATLVKTNHFGLKTIAQNH